MAGDPLATLFLTGYTHLWVLEGALRKWVPGLDTPMYVARDALAVVAVVAIMARTGRKSPKILLATVLLIAMLAWMTLSGLGSQQPLSVTAVGIRSYLSPALPILLALAADRTVALQRVSWAIVAWSPLQAALSALQATSSPSAAINRALNDEPAYFVSFGAVRASGTFTSPSGLTGYVILAFACALYLAFASTRRSLRLMGALGTISTATIVAVGGSRGAVLGTAIVLAYFLFAAVLRGGARGIRILLAAAASAVVIGLVLVSMFAQVLDAFGQRFEDASRSEDSGARLVLQLTRFPGFYDAVLGHGPGAHAQVGIAAGSPLAWIEDDSSKWAAELGVIGVAMAVARILLIFGLFAAPLILSRGRGPEFALFTSAVAASQLVGQITQTPSAQAAFGIGCALVIASITPGARATGGHRAGQRTPRARSTSRVTRPRDGRAHV